MSRIFPRILAGVLGLMAFGASTGADSPLSVEQILDRHVAARGGAEAWRKIETMAWTGHIESGPGGISKVPFLMMFQRPGATRFEVLSQGQRAVRIFDGSKGWKLTPVAGGLPNLKDYTAEEISFARDAAGLDGPLFDPKIKGVSVTLQGMDNVEGHSAYHLKVTLPSGQVRNDWIDAQSFLELRYDRGTRNAAGVMGVVSVYYRDYQPFNGLVIPLVMESGGPASKETDKMIIEKVALNPTLEPGQFTKPNTPKKHNGIVIDTRPAGAASNP
jgi:outer membrane lipoprotein-sorting protein